MTDTPARDALAAKLRLKPDGSSIRDILRHPSLVIAALVEAGYQPTDDDLRAMGGFCRNCDGAGGCMSCRLREWHDACEHDCPECGPEPWDKRLREWTFPRSEEADRG